MFSMKENETICKVANNSFSHTDFKDSFRRGNQKLGFNGVFCLTLSQTSPGFYLSSA